MAPNHPRLPLFFLCLLLGLPGLGQTLVSFEVLTKSPALVGTTFGGAVTRRSIVVRDWKDYYIYSFGTKSWEKARFPSQQMKPLHSQGWITCAYLPSFGKLLTLSEELEVLDLQKLGLAYYPIEGTVPVPGGAVVWQEKVYLLGSSLLFNLNEEPEFDIRKGRTTSIKPPRKVILPTHYFMAFDPATLRFEQLDSLPGPHFRLGAFSGDSLYAFGPEVRSGTTDVVRYNPVVNQWDSLARLPVLAGAVAEWNRNLFVLGLQDHKGFLLVFDVRRGTWRRYETNVPWTHGLAFVHENKLYYLAGMKENPKIRDVFFRHPRWLDRKMYVLDLSQFLP